LRAVQDDSGHEVVRLPPKKHRHGDQERRVRA
jgi:hypothetical protein